MSGWSWPLLLVTGGVIGLIGGFVQAVVVTVGGIGLPVGAVVVLLTLVATIRAMIHLFDRRLAGVLVLIGWVIVSVLLAFEWPGGEIVIARQTSALVYLYGGVLVASAAANLPARLRPPPQDLAGESPDDHEPTVSDEERAP